MHHFKELIVRSLISGVFAHFACLKIYGAYTVKLEPEVASNMKLQEALEDEDSL